jgi:hypothetical protein
MEHAPVSTQRITRDDIEQSLRSIQTGVNDRVRGRRATIIQGVSIATALVVLLVFLLGRRSGRKRNTIVEIRRV